jgi:hypothetical protein
LIHDEVGRGDRLARELAGEFEVIGRGNSRRKGLKRISTIKFLVAYRFKKRVGLREMVEREDREVGGIGWNDDASRVLCGELGQTSLIRRF